MFGIFQQVADALLGAWRRQAVLRELARLSDYRLADLGLRREELESLGRRGPRERKRAERLAVPRFRPELAPCG